MQEGGGRSLDIERLLAVANAVVLAFMLCAMTVSVMQVFVLQGEMAALEGQAKKSVKAVAALREDLAAIKAGLESAQPTSALSDAWGDAPKTPVVVPAAIIHGAAAQSFATRAAPVCVFQRGDASGLENCIRRGAKI